MGATNASEQGLGGAEALVTSDVSKRLSQRSEIRGEKVKLAAVLVDSKDEI